MRADLLHVFTARANPLGWRRPHENYLAFADGILRSGAHLHVVECAYGEEDFACALPGVHHIGVRAKTRGWNKENLLNIGVHRTPDARYIAWVDADVIFRRPDWAAATVRALQHYDVVQPWSDALDLGPNGELMATHRSFCHQYFYRKKLVPEGRGAFWQGDGGPYTYPHCLTADSLVVPGGEVLAASARPFEGDLVVIRTASGKELACSPNHPILTDGGWVPAKDFEVGDHVFTHVRGDGVVGEIHEQQVAARIEDVARAFGERPGVNRSTHLLPDDFDGNRVDQKIAHVWTERLLPHEAYTGLGQQHGNLGFGDVGLQAAPLDRGRTLDLLPERFGLATASGQQTAALRDGLALFGRGVLDHAGADFLADIGARARIALVPELERARTALVDRVPGGGVLPALLDRHLGSDDAASMVGVHADDACAFRRALAGQIERDEVVYVGRREFSGHLYDLKTSKGYILADGIVTHNSGFAWAMTRQAFDWVGGLFELGGMGSGDHHMALGLAGKAVDSTAPGASSAYNEEVLRWERRARRHINGNVGYVSGVIEHLFHGRKPDRGYLSRWGMFLRHGFDPHEDLKRNSHGVLEFATNKPELRHDFDLYLHARNEDINVM